LQSIYKSLRDGMASREDFFDIGEKDKSGDKELIDTLLEGKAKTKKLDPSLRNDPNKDEGTLNNEPV
jgi:hypothetical protein